MNRDIKFRLWSKIGKKFIETDNPDLDFVINNNGYLYSIEYCYGETCILPLAKKRIGNDLFNELQVKTDIN